jgi:hypothetical protein
MEDAHRKSRRPRVGLDWILLNRVLAGQNRTLEWFDSVKADPRYAPVIQHCARLLLEPLKESQRWADIGLLFPDPLATLAESHKFVTFRSRSREYAKARGLRW